MKKIYFLMIAMTLGVIQAKAAEFTVDGITYETISNTVYEGKYQNVRLITANKNLSGDIVIPELPAQWNDGVIYFRVTEIGKLNLNGEGAYIEPFDGCVHITSVTVPKSVTNIVWNVFQYHALNAIHIDEANTVYASVDGLLYNKEKTNLITCPRGKTGTIIIPNSTLNITNSAFESCNKITSIIIPNSVQTIEDWSFAWNITSLTTITVDAGNSAYSSENGILFNKDKTILIRYPQAKPEISYTIPNTIAKIGNAAFTDCTNLTSVTIPNSVTIIEKMAFMGSGLTSVAIPGSVTHLGYAAFDCEFITDITVFWLEPSPALVDYYEDSPQSPFMYMYNADLSTVNLHVPVGTKARYQALEIFNKFNIVDDLTGILPPQAEQNISVSQSAGQIIVSGLQGNEILRFYNLYGKLWLSCKAVGETENVSIDYLPSGIYFLSVRTNERTITHKFIKK